MAGASFPSSYAEWSYRQPLSIANDSSYDRQGDPIIVTVQSSNIATDGSDIRISSNSGNSIPFKIKTISTSNGVVSATLVFEAVAIPANTTVDYYVYYGNASASSASTSIQSTNYSELTGSDFAGRKNATRYKIYRNDDYFQPWNVDNGTRLGNADDNFFPAPIPFTFPYADSTSLKTINTLYVGTDGTNSTNDYVDYDFSWDDSTNSLYYFAWSGHDGVGSTYSGNVPALGNLPLGFKGSYNGTEYSNTNDDSGSTVHYPSGRMHINSDTATPGYYAGLKLGNNDWVYWNNATNACWVCILDPVTTTFSSEENNTLSSFTKSTSSAIASIGGAHVDLSSPTNSTSTSDSTLNVDFGLTGYTSAFPALYESWVNRRVISITNDSSYDHRGDPVSITFQSSYGGADLRVSDPFGNPVTIKVDLVTGSTNTYNITFELVYSPPNKTVEYYVYYGNPLASSVSVTNKTTKYQELTGSDFVNRSGLSRYKIYRNDDYFQPYTTVTKELGTADDLFFAGSMGFTFPYADSSSSYTITTLYVGTDGANSPNNAVNYSFNWADTSNGYYYWAWSNHDGIGPVYGGSIAASGNLPAGYMGSYGGCIFGNTSDVQHGSTVHFPSGRMHINSDDYTSGFYAGLKHGNSDWAVWANAANSCWVCILDPVTVELGVIEGNIFSMSNVSAYLGTTLHVATVPQISTFSESAYLGTTYHLSTSSSSVSFTTSSLDVSFQETVSTNSLSSSTASLGVGIKKSIQLNETLAISDSYTKNTTFNYLHKLNDSISASDSFTDNTVFHYPVTLMDSITTSDNTINPVYTPNASTLKSLSDSITTSDSIMSLGIMHSVSLSDYISSSDGQAEIDDYVNFSDSDTTTITTTENNELIVFGVGGYSFNWGGNYPTVTVDGNATTVILSDRSTGNVPIEVVFYVAPTSGVHNVSVNNGDLSSPYFLYFATSVKGVGYNSNWHYIRSNVGTSVTVNPPQGSFIFGYMLDNTNNNSVSWSGLTELNHDHQGSGIDGSTAYAIGDGNTLTVNCTDGGNTSGQFVVVTFDPHIALYKEQGYLLDDSVYFRDKPIYQDDRLTTPTGGANDSLAFITGVISASDTISKNTSIFLDDSINVNDDTSKASLDSHVAFSETTSSSITTNHPDEIIIMGIGGFTSNFSSYPTVTVDGQLATRIYHYDNNVALELFYYCPSSTGNHLISVNEGSLSSPFYLNFATSISNAGVANNIASAGLGTPITITPPSGSFVFAYMVADTDRQDVIWTGLTGEIDYQNVPTSVDGSTAYTIADGSTLEINCTEGGTSPLSGDQYVVAWFPPKSMFTTQKGSSLSDVISTSDLVQLPPPGEKTETFKEFVSISDEVNIYTPHSYHTLSDAIQLSDSIATTMVYLNESITVSDNAITVNYTPSSTVTANTKELVEYIQVTDSITINNASPVNLQVSINSPVNDSGSTMNTNFTILASGTTATSSDTLTDAELQIASNSTFSTIVQDAQYSTSSAGWILPNTSGGGNIQYKIQTTLSPGTYYLRMKVLDSNSNWSNWTSSVQISIIAPSFTNALTSNQSYWSTQDITELRTYINNARAFRGLSSFTFTDSTLTPNNTPTRAIHVNELRTALSDVLSIVDVTPTWSDVNPLPANSMTVLRRGQHILDIRNYLQQT